MNNIFKYIITASLLLGAISCEEEAVNDDFSHSMVTTSFGNQTNLLQINDTMSFIDLSRGIETRRWEFPEGVAIDEKGQPVTTSNKSELKVSFLKPGEYQIKIAQNFSNEVYVGDQQLDTKEYTETIPVKVLDSVRAKFTAQNIITDVALVLADNEKNKVEAGHSVRFNITSTGEPTTNILTLTRPGAEPIKIMGGANAEGVINIDHKFSTPGIYSVSLYCASTFSSSTVEYSDLVEVIPSSDPVTLDAVIRASSNEVGLVFSRAMQDASTCAIDAFTVKITNTGDDIPCNITEISTSEATVKLKLDTDIYNTDSISISYDETKGNLVTTDNTAATSFTDKFVVFDRVDIMPDGGFENCEVSNFSYAWWGGCWEKYVISMSNEIVHSGSKSWYIEMDVEGGMIVNRVPDKIELKAGVTYEIGMWLFVKSLQATDLGVGYDPNLVFEFDTRSPTWGLGVYLDVKTPIGEGIYRTVRIESTAAGPAMMIIRGCNNKFDTPFHLYVDDMTLTECELR